MSRRSKLVCSMSINAASNPASPMISTICGSAMPPTCVPSASPPSLRMRFTRFSFIPSSRGLGPLGRKSQFVVPLDNFEVVDGGVADQRREIDLPQIQLKQIAEL